LIPTKQQKRNTFSVLPELHDHQPQSATWLRNSESQHQFAMQSAICPAQRPERAKPPDNVDHCSHRCASQRFDEVTRSDPVISHTPDSSPLRHRSTYSSTLESISILGRWAGESRTEEVTGGKINGMENPLGGSLHVREMECCVRVYIGARLSCLLSMIVRIQCSPSAIPASKSLLGACEIFCLL
jgi:hypothetical protein